MPNTLSYHCYFVLNKGFEQCIGFNEVRKMLHGTECQFGWLFSIFGHVVVCLDQAEKATTIIFNCLIILYASRTSE